MSKRKNELELRKLYTGDRITTKGKGVWSARRCDGELSWGDENWAVESSTGFCVDAVCYELYGKNGDVLVDFGEYPLTIGFTEKQAKAIVNALNKKEK